MDIESLKTSITQYREQLSQVNLALSVTEEGSEKDDLLTLKGDIEQLIELTEENLAKVEATQKNEQPSTSSQSDPMNLEYDLFMKEMQEQGAIDRREKEQDEKDIANIEDQLKTLPGMKCRAAHMHSWGDCIYHNAMICSVVSSEKEIQVLVMFTNPTHLEMKPCDYYLSGDCKFTEEKCKFSHGEVISLSLLKDYEDPDFSSIKNGSKILAKNSNANGLWQRAVVKEMDKDTFTIKFESNLDEHILPIEEILPLNADAESEISSSDDDSESGSETDDRNTEWFVQKSLSTTPASEKLGEWEKYTKGIGSKLMQQMGYVIGTGLGKLGEGRLEPVPAVVLPAGKSLDHCMTLKENAGGDESLFSVERRLKKLQRQQEMRNKKAYEREKQKKDVFEFINNTIDLRKDKNTSGKKTKDEHRQELKAETNRDLNVAELKIEESIKRTEEDIVKIRQSIMRHKIDTIMHKNLQAKLFERQRELKTLRDNIKNVHNEQNVRKDKRKLTVF